MSVVELQHPDDDVDKLLYTMANPVAAALVDKSEEYPGLVSQPKDYLEGPIVVERPDVFFRNNGPTPAVAKLELVPPPGFEEVGVEGFVEMLRDELEAGRLGPSGSLRREGSRVIARREYGRRRGSHRPCLRGRTRSEPVVPHDRAGGFGR